MSPIIKLENVNITFNHQSIFSSLNFEINETGIYGIVGPNGCGKSVLFKIIAGLYTPDSGKVIVNNIILGTNGYDYPKNLGLLVDSPGFIDLYTGFENLKTLAGIQKKINETEIIEYMNELNLCATNKTKVKNYSLGMKQKLGIIQAVMENQEIIILDEPFNALDKKSVTTVKNLILKLKSQNKTILLTSHNQNDLDELCDELFYIDDYQIELMDLYAQNN